MESESAGDAGKAPVGVPLIFISDASAEAERLGSALRATGYIVADVPLSLLAGRVAVQRPALLVCDADAEGSDEILARIRGAEPLSPVPVVLLGEGDTSAEALAEAIFARPVNVQDLVATVERLIGRGALPSHPPSVRGGSKLATSSRPPTRQSVSPASRPPGDRARLDAASPSVSAPPLPPDLAEDAVPPVRESADSPVVELSGAVLQLLADAERRLLEAHPSPSSGHDELGPEIDAEGPLPPEVLVALEEPLDDEDLGGEGTPLPSQDGTGSLTSSKAAVRGYTQIGGGGTFSTTLGDGTAAPASEVSAGTATGSGGSNGSRAAPQNPDTDDGRLARQLASTPKPPRPAPDDPAQGTALNVPTRGTVPPSTVATKTASELPAAPEANAPGAAEVDGSSSSASARTAPPKPVSAEERRKVVLHFDSDPPDRGDLTSTTPPVRRPDDASVPPGNQQSERPGAPLTSPPAARQSGSDRPSAAPRTEPPSRPGERRAAPPPPPAPPLKEAPLDIPAVLRAGDAIRALATAIRNRYTGALAFEVDEGIRRVVLRDGDFVTLTSGVHGESLVAFLAGKGDLPAEVARQGHKLPAFGRRAGAALIANGHLAQDQLWPVLRSHAEWLIGRVIGIERGQAGIEEVGRLHDEPAVFGGATGAEVLVEVVRRVVTPEDALSRLGGLDAGLVRGPAHGLLAECALPLLESDRVQHVEGAPVRELLDGAIDPSFAPALHALVALGVLRVEAPRARDPAAPLAPVRDEIDDDALRARILARKVLVDDGDYFAVLGVARSATGYDIRHAYTTLRRDLEPSRALTTGTADLSDVVSEIVDVLEEAYRILSDARRRDRYRRAIEAAP